MTRVHSSKTVKAPVAFAAASLKDELNRRPEPDTPLSFDLRMPLAALGIPGGVTLDRRVVASIAPAPINGSEHPLSLSWKAEGSDAFPEFRGTVRVVDSTRDEDSVLVISGTYRPPGGFAGRVFDATVGARIARATLDDLLRQLSDRIETDYTVRREMS
jgi:hypothetical protein